MKKLLVLSMVFLILFLTAGSASAWTDMDTDTTLMAVPTLDSLSGPLLFFVPPPPAVRYDDEPIMIPR